MSVHNFASLREHIGHAIEVTVYGKSENGLIVDERNVAVECLDCNVVLMDFDKEDPNDPDPTNQPPPGRNPERSRFYPASH